MLIMSVLSQSKMNSRFVKNKTISEHDKFAITNTISYEKILSKIKENIRFARPSNLSITISFWRQQSRKGTASWKRTVNRICCFLAPFQSGLSALIKIFRLASSCLAVEKMIALHSIWLSQRRTTTCFTKFTAQHRTLCGVIHLLNYRLQIAEDQDLWLAGQSQEDGRPTRRNSCFGGPNAHEPVTVQVAALYRKHRSLFQ